MIFLKVRLSDVLHEIALIAMEHAHIKRFKADRQLKVFCHLKQAEGI